MDKDDFNTQCLLHFGASIEDTLKLVISARKLKRNNHKAYKKRIEKSAMKARPLQDTASSK